ncbi:MAG: DNA replication/repair protein RecF [Clostridia bacterium]
MHITKLELECFRNYARAQFCPCPGITVLYGDNAQGKTALLEAVYLSSTGRSHRTPRDRELIMWDQPIARVRVVAERRDGSHEVEIALSRTERKTIKVSGNPIGRSGELMGHVTSVLFAPEDLSIVKDGPAERRRFIDMELSQIKPAYYYQLQRYSRALSQRARLLKEAIARPSLCATIPMWDEQLALSGAKIIEYRRAFVEKLAAHAQKIHRGLSADREKLDVRYQCTIASGESGAQLSDALYQALEKARPSDERRLITSVGPHRDDLALLLNGVDARMYGSQGQQRSCALSLKLSELSVMREETGEAPILMLDDVMSELDPTRRRQLLETLEGVQTLITCTDPGDLAGALLGLLQRISAGTLS